MSSQELGLLGPGDRSGETAPLRPNQSSRRSARCTKGSACAILLIGVLVIIAVVAAPSYFGCFTHDGMYFCPGDCLIQEGDEEYCPDGPDERPFLIYDITENPHVMCNDGTIPRVHFRESLPGPHETEWIFRFEGGNACFNEDACTIRLEDDGEFVFLTAATASVFYNDYLGGMLNGSPRKNPEWHDYNAVDLHYCTSDQWSGNSSAEFNDIPWDGWPLDHPESGWHFRGVENMLGAIMQAHHEFGMTNDQATRVIVSGFSAGCMGMMSASEVIKEWFDEHLPDAELFFLCDSGWFMSSAPSNDDTQDCTGGALECPLAQQMEMGWELWKPVVPQTCLDAGLSGPECLVLEYSFPYLTTKDITFVQENTYDIMQTELHVVGGWSSGEAEPTDEFRIELAQQVLDSLSEKATAFTSANCDNHDSTNRDWMYEIEWEGELLSYYFKTFMDEGTLWKVADPIVDEDGNIGEKLNPTCPDVSQTPHFHGLYPV